MGQTERWLYGGVPIWNHPQSYFITFIPYCASTQEGKLQQQQQQQQ